MEYREYKDCRLLGEELSWELMEYREYKDCRLLGEELSWDFERGEEGGEGGVPVNQND